MRRKRLRRSWRPLLEQLEDRRLLACDTVQRDRTLQITGDDTVSLVDIVADGRSLQVTCDGQPLGAFRGVNALLIALQKPEAGMRFDAEEALGAGAIKDTDGDGLPEIVDGLGSAAFFEFISGAGAQRFDIGAGAANGLLQVDVADADDGFHRMRFTGVATEFVRLDMGDGDDQATIDNSNGLLNRIAIEVFGEGGDDVADLKGVLSESSSGIDSDFTGTHYNGGEGHDSFTLRAASFTELIEVLDEPETQIVDRRIRVTEPVRNVITFQGIVAEIEEVTIESGGGDDVFDVAVPPPTATELTLSGGGSRQSPPSHRLYRLFELLSTGDRAESISPRGRIPGRVNINGVWGTDAVIVYGDRNPDLFEIGPGANIDQTQIVLSDLAGVAPVQIVAEEIETLTAIGVDGEDHFQVMGPLGTDVIVHAGARSGASQVQGTLFIAKQQALRDRQPYRVRLVEDQKLAITSSDLAERFDITGIAGDQFDSVETRVSDAATGSPLAFIVAHAVELQSIEAGFGDDLINIAVPSRFRTRLAVSGQDGNDDITISIHGAAETLPPTPSPNPPPDEPLASGIVGGVGHDRLRIVGSTRSELYEIVGVPIQGFPDPEVRIIDLETNVLMDVISFVEFEEFVLDDRGGDNKIVMREEGAPLSEIDWTIMTGDGQDTFDAQMGALPDVLHVMTGKGDDEVTAVFGRGPLVPPIDLEAPVPEITVDVGSGVDSVVLDVFGSLQPQPPSDLGDISIQVTLQEVLAAIFVTGVGQLALLTLFPLGALEMQQAIQDDRAGNASTEARIDLAGANLGVELTTGATLDTVLIDLNPRPHSRVDLDLSTGTGLDDVTVTVGEGLPESFSLFVEQFLGQGPRKDGRVLVLLESGDLQEPVHIGALWNIDASVPPEADGQQAASMTIGFTQAAGAPSFRSTLVGSPGRDDIDLSLSGALHEATLNLATGDGDDDVQIRVAPGIALDRLASEIDTGAGDDQVTVNIPAVQTDGMADIVVATDAGAGPHVKVFDGGTNADVQSFFAYSPSFSGGVRVAAGDVNGDGVADIITGAGPGAGPHVKVFDGRTNAELMSFFAFGPQFTGGVFVAAGDVNGDGRDDIITGADKGAPGGHVKVFDGATGGEIRSFLAFDPSFSGGVRVAAGDVNGDGFADIVVGAGPGAGPHVKVFDGATHTELASFFAYGQFAGGVHVAAGDVNNDGRDDIITGAGEGSPGGHVKVFGGANLQELRSFFAYGPNFTGGVRVAAGDVNGDGVADIVTGAGPGAGPHVKVFEGQTNAELRSFFAFDPIFSGGVFVAAGDLHASRLPRRVELDLVIDTHAGNDAVAVHLGAAATEERIERVRISTGAGLDSVQFEVFFPTQPCGIVADYGIDTGAHDDIVGYALRTAPGQALGPHGPEPQELNVKTRIDTAAGNDRLSFDWLVHTDRQLVSAIELLTGAGHDISRVRIAEAEAPRPQEQVFQSYHFFQDAGAGNDRLSLHFSGAILDGEAVDAILRGGAGNDILRAQFDLAPGITGRLRAEVHGQAGNDDLALEIFGGDNLADLFALLDGGPGRDKCKATRNVLVKNCP